ncbi:MAG: macro domain-containing protein [Gammaproteobacteria bacterium]|nr:macro domain-containing protein [Gammaproteobacteria bacterium]
MPIVYEGFGNVLNHKAQTITCPVNTVGVMGAGLALFMRNRVQGLKDHYKRLCYTGDLTIGKCQVYKVPEKEKLVLLFPSKDHWKDDSKIEYIESGLKDLVKNIEKLGIKELAMVPIGCGLGKLDYHKDVRPLFEKYLDPLDIDVYLLHREA